MERGLAGDFRRIRVQLDEMEAICRDAEFDRAAPGISTWPVARQLDHLSRVGGFVTRNLVSVVENGRFLDPETPRKPNLAGRILLGLAWIPRGIGKAPKSAQPDPAPEAAEVGRRLSAMRESLAVIEPGSAALRASGARLRHPYFGGLTPRRWLRFLWVHQHHHLKIVREILAS